MTLLDSIKKIFKPNSKEEAHQGERFFLTKEEIDSSTSYRLVTGNEIIFQADFFFHLLPDERGIQPILKKEDLDSLKSLLTYLIYTNYPYTIGPYKNYTIGPYKNIEPYWGLKGFVVEVDCKPTGLIFFDIYLIVNILEEKEGGTFYSRKKIVSCSLQSGQGQEYWEPLFYKHPITVLVDDLEKTELQLEYDSVRFVYRNLFVDLFAKVVLLCHKPDIFEDNRIDERPIVISNPLKLYLTEFTQSREAKENWSDLIVMKTAAYFYKIGFYAFLDVDGKTYNFRLIPSFHFIANRPDQANFTMYARFFQIAKAMKGLYKAFKEHGIHLLGPSDISQENDFVDKNGNSGTISFKEMCTPISYRPTLAKPEDGSPNASLDELDYRPFLPINTTAWANNSSIFLGETAFTALRSLESELRSSINGVLILPVSDTKSMEEEYEKQHKLLQSLTS